MNTNKTTGNEKKQRRAITAVCIAVITFFCAIIFGGFLLSAIFPDREKSENENRVLKQFPKFSLSALFDGSFTKNLEIYLNDQFPFRDSIITLKTKVDRIAGKTEENGVYIGKDKFLFEAPAKAEEPAEEAEKAPAKKETVKKETKAATKKAEVKADVQIQFSGKAYTTDELVKIAKDVWKYDLGKKEADFKTVELYVKPEESLTYYVINGEVSGSFAI